MSKRNKKRKSTYERRYQKPLIKGKFYRIMDSNGGHYSRLYKKNTKKNKYWIVRFTDSEGRHRELLLHQIDPTLENTGAKSFVITQPQIVKYENFKHPYPYENFRIHKDDRKTVKKDTKEKMSHTRLLQPLCACSL
ncbi:MAG: hypothetical protein IJQ67_03795 [Bacilli bacterium]|nr:hypothetical protein [Bacilli bacterium]